MYWLPNMITKSPPPFPFSFLHQHLHILHPCLLLLNTVTTALLIEVYMLLVSNTCSKLNYFFFLFWNPSCFFLELIIIFLPPLCFCVRIRNSTSDLLAGSYGMYPLHWMLRQLPLTGGVLPEPSDLCCLDWRPACWAPCTHPGASASSAVTLRLPVFTHFVTVRMLLTVSHRHVSHAWISVKQAFHNTGLQSGLWRRDSWTIVQGQAWKWFTLPLPTSHWPELKL